MRRREVIALLGSAVAGLPLVAHAQEKLPTLGFLGSGTPSSQRTQTAAFVQRLHDLGWTEQRNIAIAYRWAEGHADRYAEIAAEFVRLKVDVIVASGTASVLAAKQATSAIPIVFAVVNDPLGSGLVASLARPGGNVTGLSLQNPDLAGKRLEILREVVPGFRRLLVMANVDNPGANAGDGRSSSHSPKARCRSCRSSTSAGRGYCAHIGHDQGRRKCAVCLQRRAHNRQPEQHRHLGAPCEASDDERPSRVCRRGRSDILWSEHSGPVSARCGLRR